jgi:prephenate dehydrogenase
MTSASTGRLAVIGTGLVGASVGLAARHAGVEHVSGYDPAPEALAAAVEVGALDSQAQSLAGAASGADLVVVATPVSAVAASAAEALGATGGECAVTDVGSTKARICSALAGESRFVGGHPLAGSEKQGAQHARADLFAGSIWFLTPLSETDDDRYRQVREFVSLLGATPVETAPTEHDRLVALVSHLPHALASVLVNQAAAADALDLAGGSFRDLTRVAGANPPVWTDILLGNAEFVADALGEYRRRLEDLERVVRAGDEAALRGWLEQAARERFP